MPSDHRLLLSGAGTPGLGLEALGERRPSTTEGSGPLETAPAAISASPLRISVVTAVRNGGATIADTLESVNAQTWPAVEHVIIDGRSSDDTLDVIKTRGRRVTTTVSESDTGIYDAFNKGLAHAAGDVIGYLHADDYYASPDVLTRVAAVFAAEDVDAVYGDAAFVAAHDLSRVVRWYDSGHFRPGRLAYGVMPAHTALFVRRRVFQRCGPFDTSYRIAGDFEFIVRAFGIAKVSYRYVPELFVIMRTGGVSTQGLGSTRTISREIVRACRQNGVRSSGLHALVRYLWKVRDWQRGRTRVVSAPASRNML